VNSLINNPDTVDFTVGIVANSYMRDLSRCIKGVFKWSGKKALELVVLDNNSSDGTGEWLENMADRDNRIRVFHTDYELGQGAAENIVLKLSLGRIIVLLDTSVEPVGDFLSPIDSMLNDERIGIVGPFGLRTTNLHDFSDGEGESGEMDAMQKYCFAFRRSSLISVGLMRESFRFYRNLDLDYSFQFKDKGYRIVADTSLPLTRHEHRIWSELGETERQELSKRNYKRFLDKWGGRNDLLVSQI
jgi:GT2 family glycosyltransferase